MELCNRVILQEKVVIKKVVESDCFKKWDDMNTDKLEEKEMLGRINTFLQAKRSDA